MDGDFVKFSKNKELYSEASTFLRRTRFANDFRTAHNPYKACRRDLHRIPELSRWPTGMILSKHVRPHDSHPHHRAAKFLRARTIPWKQPPSEWEGRKATMPGGVVQEQQIGPSIRRKKDEFVCKSRKGATFERPPRFHRAPNVPLRDVLCRVMSTNCLL